MKNANKDYYKRVYGKVNASDELKERLMDMKNMENRNRKNKRMAWKAAVAAAAVVVALPTGIFAATKYWGIGDFMSEYGKTLSPEANELIETDIEQVKKDEEAEQMPVGFTVRESLCDRGSVSIIVEARAKERGKYLLVGPDSEETYPVSDLGIKKDKRTIGQYAKDKGLEIINVNSGFDHQGGFFPDSESIEYKQVEDDVLNLCIRAKREKDQKDLHVILKNTIQTPEIRATGGDSIVSTNSFDLTDKSSSDLMEYKAKKAMKIKGTSAKVTKITVEKTEVGNYINVYYTNPDADKEDGLTFRMKNSKDSEEWNFKEGFTEKLEDGTYRCRMDYESGELPKTCVLEAFDCMEKNVFGQFKVSLSR